MKSSDYWKERFKALAAASNSYGRQTYSQIEKVFIQAQRNIQKEIDVWYSRFATNNGITLLDAKKLLNSGQLAELKWDVNEYIKYGRQNAIDGKWMKQLENASARFHITRLEALQLRTQQALEKAFGNELDDIDRMARHILTEDYYQSIFEVQRGFNIGWDIGQIKERDLKKVIVKPWAADGKNFSDRIWQKKAEMITQLHQELTRTLIQGKAPDKAIEHLEQFVGSKFKSTRYAASRLVMTEQAYFHSVSQQKAFDELDVEEYEIVAVLDSHTCGVCGDMDGKHFPMKNYEAGVTAPPFHPNCRTVTVPYFEDNYGGMRAARDKNGKTHYVPDNMTYEEWKEAYVDREGLTNGEESGIMKMERQRGIEPNMNNGLGVIKNEKHTAAGNRRSPFYELTDEDIEAVKAEIKAIGANVDDFIFNSDYTRGTCFLASDDKIHIKGNIFPDENSTHPRDKLSVRAVLSHEYYGHRPYREQYLREDSDTSPDAISIIMARAWADEFRASYMAAKNAPNLSQEDRALLILDALSRAEEAGVSIKYNNFIRRVLYG